MRSSLSLLIAVGLASLLAPARAQEPEPRHPRELVYPPLEFTPPSAAAHRTRLANGLTAYLVPDPLLPSVRIRAYIRTGAIYDAEEKEGLAGLAFTALRSCGAGALDPLELEAKLDELGATLEAECGDTRATVDAWTLSANLDEVMDIFVDVLRRPTFEEERFTRIRDDMAAEARTDEDDSAVLAARRMRETLYGVHPYARFRTSESLATLKRDDAREFHKKHVTPGRVVLAVSGRFELEPMKKLLEKLLGTWKGEGKGWEEVEKVTRRAKGGIRILDRPDMTAAYIELGHVGLKAGAKEEAALILTDHIWGAGSFTSRVVAKIRTEEALAYTCGSDFETSAVVPGIVRTYMQSQASEASYALKLALDEAKRLQQAGPTPGELERAKQALIGRAPARFTTASDRARALAEADLDGLPDDHYATYKDRILAVTAEDVKATTARFYGPEGLSIVIVGPAATVRRSASRGTSLDELGTVRVE